MISFIGTTIYYPPKSSKVYVLDWIVEFNLNFSTISENEDVSTSYLVSKLEIAVQALSA